MGCGWSSTRRRSRWSRLRSRWRPHPTSGRRQVGIRLVDLLEALGRLVHIVAIPVGVVEERQLLERFFYGCLVRLFVESQHFEVLGAGRRHRSGCPWWCQLFRAAQGVQRRADESRLESTACCPKQRHPCISSAIVSSGKIMGRALRARAVRKHPLPAARRPPGTTSPVKNLR